MTLINVDGFELQDYTLRYVQTAGAGAGGSSTVTTTPFGYGRSLQTAAGSYSTNGNTYRNYKYQLPSASAKLTIGCYYYWGGAGTNSATQRIISVFGDAGATLHGFLGVTNAGAINAHNGAATVLSTVATIVAGWNHFEWTQTVSDTVGTIEVRMNGVVVYTFSGDTRNGGTLTTLDSFALGGGSSPTGASTTSIVRWDDVYALNDLGSRNNAPLGPCQVQTLLPNGAGSSTQWSPTAPPNYSDVNDAPDNSAIYVYDGTAGHRDTYAMDDLQTGTDTIYGVQQVSYARALDAGPNKLKQAQKSGATVSYGTTQAVSPTSASQFDIFEVNPATGVAYTQSELNAIEAGFELTT